MRTRLLVPALAITLAVAIAVPALAQPENVAPRLQKISKRALVKSTLALRVARQAQRRVAIAQADAAAALGEAASAKNAAATASAAAAAASAHQGTGEVAKIVSATETATVTTGADISSPEALGGPSLQVTVPSSGLIEVWAQVETRNEEGGAVALYEDGSKVPGVSNAELCGDESVLIDAALLPGEPDEFSTASTPPVPGFVGCGSAGAPSSVLLNRPPGPHTYELRYSECSCGGPGEAEFRNRVLRIAPRP